MKVLTIKTSATTETEIHMLNPRECMPRFGGSRSGLVVGETASLVTRAKTAGMQQDVEREITDPFIWDYIARCINGEIKVTATVIDKEETEAA